MRQTPFLEGAGHFRVFGIRAQAVTAAFHEAGKVEGCDAALAVERLGALAPLEFDADLVAIDAGDVISHAVVRVIGVKLHKEHAVAVVVAQIAGNAAIQVRQGLDAAILVENRPGVATAHIFANDKGYAAEGRAHGKAVPVLVNHGIAAQCAQNERKTAGPGRMAAEMRGNDGIGVGDIARSGLFGVKTFRAENPATDAQRVIGYALRRGIVAAQRSVAVILRNERPAPQQRAEPGFALALAVHTAKAAQP